MCRMVRQIVEFGRYMAIGNAEPLLRRWASGDESEKNVEEFKRQISAERVCSEVDVIENGKFQLENSKLTLDTSRQCQN